MPVAKKVTKNTTRTIKPRTVKSKITPSVPELASVKSSPKLTKPFSLNPRFFTFLLIVIAVALVVFKYGAWFIPAKVGNQPITRFAIWKKLETNYGKQTLDDLVNEMIVDKAIANSGVVVEQAKLDEQIATIRTQVEDVGGLDEVLKQRGMTQADLEKSIRRSLTLEEILKDQAGVTDEEIKKDFDDNATTLYKDSKFEEVKDQITSKLKNAKLSDAYNVWFTEAKKSIPVKNLGL